MSELKYTAADFKSDQEVKWCPGCGDYAVLNAVQKALPEVAEAAGTRVFWVGLPIMGREPYGGRVKELNQVVAGACETSAVCEFWDAWLSVADQDGKYSVQAKDAEGKTVRVRAKDSIHLTEKGGEIMAEKFLAETGDWADYQQKGQFLEYSFPSALLCTVENCI